MGTDASGTPDGGEGGDELPLLGSSRGGHYWFAFCEGQSDDTPVPQDPRELVVPGVNAGKAVYMNGFWQTCQDDNHPGTCGELRRRAERGYAVVASDGEVGAGSLFSGDTGRSTFAFSASAYADVWRAWGLTERPDNFDELAAQRWGTPLSPTPNPYPLPGEDPNDPAHPGGSGQLPMALTQLREADGTWTSTINVTCNVCHAGKVGEAADGPGLGAIYGTNSLSDITVMFTDIGTVAPAMSALGVFALNKLRGTGNITNFQFFGMLELTGNVADVGPGLISIQGEPSTGTEDPPVWWNLGHRVTKFFDGAQVADAKRIELSFHLPNAPVHGFPPGALWEEDKQWILDHQQDADAWISSLRSPAWPEAKLGAIDTRLAEAGAILFHERDLWGEGFENPTPPPDGGNGSCASCHGAYSPRYVNDPRFLDSPLLEGIASHIVPIEIIGTDRKRLEGNSEAVVRSSRPAWFAYADGPLDEHGVPLCGNWNDEALRGDRKLGYLAPPLYGVWASAPYFHNGSVPNVWEVLKPADRKTVWRRASAQPPVGQGDLVMGFSSSLGDYDTEKLGWRYDELECDDAEPLDCSRPEPETVGDTLETLLNTGLAWNLLNLPVMNDAQVEDRKIYNTTVYSQGNTGHEFTAVLSDDERLAIIEYLKTL
jgi:mono/diheme cytochrome c family protein